MSNDRDKNQPREIPTEKRPDKNPPIKDPTSSKDNPTNSRRDIELKVF